MTGGSMPYTTAEPRSCRSQVGAGAARHSLVFKMHLRPDAEVDLRAALRRIGHAMPPQ